MAHLTYRDVKVSGVAACVPRRVVKNTEFVGLLSPEEVDKTINSIGIKEKRFAALDVCASDLCFAAAEQLLAAMKVERETIDVLIFVSQTPDYLIPATAPLLQHRLGLPETCAAFDLSLGCSGYVYGLATAFAYAAQPTVRRVLLLDGETFSKVVGPRDKVNAPLYGDAGSATIVERSDGTLAHFALFSNGAGRDVLLVPAGGFREPASAETVQETLREEGNYRSDHQIYMDGVEVFNFTIKAVPHSVRDLLGYANLQLEDIDRVIFHQANRFMTDFLAKKLKVPKDKMPYCMDWFGNTSSASIPLTIASELRTSLEGRSRVLLSGFGAGLSWAGAVLDLSGCSIPPLVEV